MSEDQHNQAVEDPLDDTDVASMEDILASIRSMIAEDNIDPPAPAAPAPSAFVSAPPEPLHAPEPVAPEIPAQTSSAVAMPSESELDAFGSLDSLLEPMDLAIPDVTPPAEIEAIAETPVTPEPIVPVSVEPEPVADLDLDSLFEPLDMAELAEPEAAPSVEMAEDVVEAAPLADPVEFDMAALDIDLVDTPEPVAAEAPSEPAPSALTDEEDMELVKSLMADLTEAEDAGLLPTEADEVESTLDLESDWFTEDLSIPEIEPEAPSEISAEADILDEILEQSVADEEVLRAELEREPLSVSEGTSALPTVSSVAGAGVAGAAVVSLADIAASAQREAGTLDSTLIVEESVEMETVVEPTIEIFDEPEVAHEPAPEPEITPEAVADEALVQALEEEVMARTAPLEEILADEVEADTTNAFAELNRLVEEKNIVEESGPRIGDLVQEALKPMLKEWLDENLKSIVERAVQKEVKRIASGK
jgi:cell pole-organizing protein PopZ